MTDLRLATFNLLHGMSLRDGTVSEPSLAAAVADLGADVLGLQEVDSAQPRSGGSAQASVAAAAMGAVDWRYLPTLVGTPGPVRSWRPTEPGEQAAGLATYGVALLSRLPVLRWAEMRFAAAPFGTPLIVPSERGPRVMVIPDEPRGALAAVVETAAGPVSVITAHLSFVPGFNVRQLRQLTRWARAELPAPRVLLGDLNLPGPLPRLASGWERLSRLPTYPASRPRVAFDAALGDGLLAGRTPWGVTSVDVRTMQVSDHAALVVGLSSS